MERTHDKRIDKFVKYQTSEEEKVLKVQRAEMTSVRRIACRLSSIVIIIIIIIILIIIVLCLVGERTRQSH